MLSLIMSLGINVGIRGVKIKGGRATFAFLRPADTALSERCKEHPTYFRQLISVRVGRRHALAMFSQHVLLLGKAQ